MTDTKPPLSIVDADEALRNGQGDAEQRSRERDERRERVLKLRLNGWKIPLQDGHTATLCDPATVRERYRRVRKQAQLAVAASSKPDKDGNPTEVPDARLLASLDDTLIVMFLQSWTLPLPLPTPTAMDSLQELSGPDYDALVWACKDLEDDAYVDRRESEDAASPKGA